MSNRTDLYKLISENLYPVRYTRNAYSGHGASNLFSLPKSSSSSRMPLHVPHTPYVAPAARLPAPRARLAHMRACPRYSSLALACCNRSLVCVADPPSHARHSTASSTTIFDEFRRWNLIKTQSQSNLLIGKSYIDARIVSLCYGIKLVSRWYQRQRWLVSSSPWNMSKNWFYRVLAWFYPAYWNNISNFDGFPGSIPLLYSTHIVNIWVRSLFLYQLEMPLYRL
jgi:hypothetical protein